MHDRSGWTSTTRGEAAQQEAARAYAAERGRKQAQAAQQANASGPIPLTACSGRNCNDTMGRTYMGDPGGSIFIRTDGKTCQRIGTLMQCN